MWVLLAILAVAAASPTLLHQETSIRPGKEYSFRYTTQVLSGVSVDNIQYTGLKIKANVKLQTKDGTKVTCVMDSLTILKLNDEIRNYHPADMIPDSVWTPVNGPEKDVINAEIIKPFAFTMVPGKFVDLETETSDPYWSVNVKRGLLSLMQLDLTEQERVRVDPDKLRILNKLNIVTPTRESQNRTYRVMEEDITGKCESVYSVDEAIRRTSATCGTLKVTKVKNFENCITRPLWKTGLMENIMFKSEAHLKKVTRWQMEAEYVVQGDRTNFLIKGAKLTSRQHFNSLDIERGKLLTYTVQMLTLEDVEEVRVPHRLSAQVEKKDSLIMDVPEPIITERDPVTASLSSPEVRAKMSLMEDLLTEIAEETTPYVKENATNVLTKITYLMRDMPLPAIESIVEKYCTTTEVTPKGEILLNTLAASFRPDVVPVFVKLINNNIISDFKGSVMMKFISLYGTSTPMLVYDLMQSVKTGLPRHATSTRHSALLTLGTMTYKLMQKMNTPAGRAVQVETILERIATEMTSLLHSATTNEDKIWILSSMANAGLPELITPIKTLITTTTEHPRVRVKAIYALRRIAPIVPTEVQNIVIPLYKDATLPVDMRVGAFIITMQTNPTVGVLKLITQQLKREPSLHVGSFVYSYLKDMSDLKTPMLKNMTMTIKTALKFVRPITPGFQYSKAIIKDIYSDVCKSGGIFSFEYLNTPKSALPDTIIYRNDYDFVGFPFGGYEMGLEMDGLQTLVKNVMGPKSILKDLLSGRLSLKDILEPIQYPSPSMLSHIRSIMEKISITERGLQNFVASMYMKAYDNEMGSFKFDSSHLESLVQSVISDAPEYIRKLERGMQWKTTQALPVIEAAMIVPTPCGLPLALNQTGNNLMGIDVTLTVENMPSLRDILSLVGSQSRNLRLPEIKSTIAGRTSFIIDTNITVGVELALLRTSLSEFTKTYYSYPATAETRVAPETGTIKLKFNLPEREEEFMKGVVLTTTSFITKPTTPTSPWTVDEKIVEFPLIGRPFLKLERIRIPLIEMDLEILRDKTLITRPTTIFTSVLAKKIATFTLKPTTETPRDVSLEALYVRPWEIDRASVLIRDLLDIEHVQESSSSEEDDDSWWSWGGRSRRSSHRRDVPSRAAIPFSPVEPDPSIRSPIKRKLVMVVKSHKSGQEEKKVQLQLTNIENSVKSQHNLQVIYVPMLEPSGQEKKIAVSSMLHLDTAYKWLVEGYIPRASEKDLLHRLELYYGPKDYTRKYLDIETRLGRGAPLSWPLMHSSRLSAPVSAPLELSLDIDYEMIPRSMIRSGLKLKELIKVLPYITSYIRVESEEARNPPNRVKLVAELLTNQTEIELLILTPSETNKIKGIPIPLLPKKDQVCSLSDVACHDKWLPRDVELWNNSDRYPVRGFIHYISGGKLPGQCKVYRDDIETYDKKVLKIPQTDCEIILAKDCSSSMSPEFMVTMKKLRKDESKKIIHIYLPEHKIKIEPESSWFGKDIYAEVNDRRISVPDSGEEILIRRQPRDSRSEEICRIKKEDEKIVVTCPKTGIKVKSDGVDVTIEPCSSYHNQLCGVCSNFNSEPMDDLMGPRKELYTKAGPFILSYIMSEPTCNIEEVREELLSRIPVPILGASRSECHKEMKTHKLEHSVHKKRETCFSVRPVPECVGACSEPSKIKKTVAYHCVRSKDRSAELILDELKRSPVVEELAEAEVHLHKELEVPEMCYPARP